MANAGVTILYQPITEGDANVPYINVTERLLMVPRVGVEPTLPKEQDFESSASANFAIWASINDPD